MAKTKRNSRTIVTGYLEKVSAGIFDKYRKQITELIQGNQGVYALYKRNNLYYVGLATDLRRRINYHLRDKHQGKWTHFSLYIIRKSDHIKELESLLLRIADPKGNRQYGKLKSLNILPELKRKVVEQIKKEITDLFEERPARTKKPKTIVNQKIKTKQNTKRPLADMFPTGKVIYATYKGKDYKAWVNRIGRIRLHHNKELFDSPSSAGQAIRKRATNGWVFWKFKDKSSNLLPLREKRG